LSHVIAKADKSGTEETRKAHTIRRGNLPQNIG